MNFFFEWTWIYIENKSSISRDRRREERENVCPLKQWNIIGFLALTGTLGAMISQGCFVMKLPDGRYITQNTKCSISCNKYTILNAKDTNNAILIKKYTNKIPSTPFQIISSWWQEQRIEEELSGWAIDWSFDRLSRVQKVWTLAVYQFWQLLEALPCLSWCHQLADCCIH